LQSQGAAVRMPDRKTALTMLLLMEFLLIFVEVIF